jgi:3-hydroxyisobutyrate dehydrogenase-like beta-hydroxyacid dehydrogenase
MDLGFIGLGNMGAGMAARLLAAGHRLKIYNRTPGKAATLVAAGAVEASSPAEACAGAAAVVTMVSDDPALEAIVFGLGGLLASLGAGAIHVSSSTIGVALAKRLAAAHRDAGQRFVAAPVFGRPEAAASGMLFVVPAGDPAALTEAAPIFEAIGQRVFPIGDQPEAATLVKLSGNFLIATVIEALGEALALTGKAGIDPAAYLDILTSTLFAAPVYKTYGGLIRDRKFAPAGFEARLGAKDIRLTLAAAEALQVPLPLASLLRDRFLRLIAGGNATLDWSALGGLAAEDAGGPALREASSP